MLEPTDEFAVQLRAFRRRVALLTAERMACWGMAAAGIIALVLVAIGDFGIWYIAPGWLLGLALAGGVIGLIIARIRPASDLAITLAIDRRLSLKERTSTAVALDATHDPEFRALVTADATSHLAAHQPHLVFPRTFARPYQAVPAVWVVVLIVFFLPDIPWLHSAAAREDMQAIKDAGKSLQTQAQELRKQPELSNSEVARQVADNMERLGKDLERRHLSKKDALKKLNKFDEQMADMEQRLAQEQEQEEAAMADEAMKMRTPEEAAAAEKARQQMAAGVPRAKLSPRAQAALRQLEMLQSLSGQLKSGKLSAARQSLRQIAKTLDTRNLTPAQKKALQQMMQRLANASKNMQMAPGSMQMLHGQLSAIKGLLNGKSGMAGKGGKPGGKNGMGMMGNNPGKDGKPGLFGLSGNGSSNQSGQGNGGHSPNGYGGAGGGPGNDNQYTPNGAALDPTADPRLDPDAQAASVDVLGAPGRVGQSHVPYTEVFKDYRNRAETAVDAEMVPPDKRRWVKEYFNSLDPAGH